MLKQQVVLNVHGDNHDELAAAIRAAGEALATKPLDEVEKCGDARFSVTRGVLRSSSYDPNTLYVVGTDGSSNVVIRSVRTSFDAPKDYAVMSSALELSQAVELRGIHFEEHQVGSLLVRPVRKDIPLREVAQTYELSHITDLVKLDEQDIAYFIKDLPGLIATLRFVKEECEKRGEKLPEVMPLLQYVADSSGTVTLNAEGASITAEGSALIASWSREQAAGGGCGGKCKIVRDDDAPRHGCCQTCEKVINLG